MVTRIVTTHHFIIITVSNQSTTNLPKLTNSPKFMKKFHKQKLFKDVISKAISACAQKMATVLKIDFFQAVLEEINYLVF